MVLWESLFVIFSTIVSTQVPPLYTLLQGVILTQAKQRLGYHLHLQCNQNKQMDGKEYYSFEILV